MKQHITVEQLNELSDTGKEKLRKWWKPNSYERYTNYIHFMQFHADQFSVFDKSLPLLSIGQMIEYLLELQKKHTGQYLKKDTGVLSIMLAVSDIRPIKVLTWQGDLCNALWEAVKEHLEL